MSSSVPSKWSRISSMTSFVESFRSGLIAQGIGFAPGTARIQSEERFSDGAARRKTLQTRASQPRRVAAAERRVGVGEGELLVLRP